MSPDLQDLQSDGKRRVTGKPYADAARDAMTRLVPEAPVEGNKLAPKGRNGLDFATLAGEWGVSDDLIGATVGPGGSRWLDAGATTIVGTRHHDTHYRVIAEGAAWERDS